MPLTAAQEAELEEVRRKYGAEAAVTMRKWWEGAPLAAPVEAEQPFPGLAAPLVDPGAPKPKERPTRAEMNRLIGGYMGRQIARYEKEGVDPAAAQLLAAKDLARITTPREVSFRSRKALVPTAPTPRPSGEPGAKKPWEYEGPRAVFEAFKQQRFETEEQAAERKQAEVQGRHLRDRLLVLARAYKDETGQPAEEYLERWEQGVMQSFMARAESPEEGRQAFLAYLRHVFPERLPGKERAMVRFGEAITRKEGLPPLPGLEGAVQRPTQLSHRDMLALLVDPFEGPLAETKLSTVLRDMTGLWRFALTPLQEALTWDEDEDGEPVDPTDIAYRIDSAAKKAWQAKYPGTELPPAVTIKGLPPIVPRPFQARRHDPERARLDYWQSVAKDIAQFRFLGDDFSDLPEYSRLWESMGYPGAPWWIGMGAEILLPIVPPVHKPVGAAARGVAGAAKARGMARTALVAGTIGDPAGRAQAASTRRLAQATMAGVEGAPKLPTGIDAHTVRAVTARHVAREFTAAEALLQAVKAGDDPAAKALELGLEDAHVARKVATMVGPGEAEAYLARYTEAMAKSENPVTRKAYGFAQQAMRTVEALPEEQAVLARAGIEAALATGDPQRLAAVQRILASTKLTDEAQTEALRRIASTATPTPAARVAAAVDDFERKLAQELLDQVPENMVFVTPTVVVTRKAWQQLGDQVGEATEKLLVGEVAKDGWKVNTIHQGRRLANEVVRALGADVVAKGDYWLPLVQRLRAGRPISQQGYKAVADLVIGNLWERGVKGSERLRYFDRQAKEAMVPTERRIRAVGGVGGNIRAIARGIADATAKMEAKPGAVGAHVPDLVLTGQTPIEVANWLRAVREAEAGLTDTLKADFGTAYKQTKHLPRKRRAPVAFQSIVDDTQAVATAGLEKAALEKRMREQWEQLAQVFFGAVKKEVDLSTGAVHFTPASRDTVKAFANNWERVAAEVNPLDDITPANLAAFLERVRDKVPDLRGKGLASRVGLPGFIKEVSTVEKVSKWEDALLETLGTWVLLQRKNNLVRESAARLVAEVPELEIPGRFIADETRAALWLDDFRILSAFPDAAEQAAVNSGIKRAFAQLRTRPGEVNQQLFTSLVRQSWEGGPATFDDVIARVKTPLDDVVIEGLAEGGYHERLLESFLLDVKRDLLRPVYDFHVTMLENWGVLRGAGKTEPIAYIPRLFKQVGQAEGMGAIIGEKASKLSQELTDITRTDLLDMLQPYRLRDKVPRFVRGEETTIQAWRFAWASAGYAWNLARRVTITGLLGGMTPFTPITRFHAINAFTAPLIMAATVGHRLSAKSVAGVLEEIADGTLGRLVYDVGRFGPDHVAFVDRQGRSWTNRMLEEAIERNNIRFSQTSFEFGDVILKEIKRVAKTDSRVQASFHPLGPRQVMRWIDPRHKNMWSSLAEINDNAFRRNVFKAALKEGKIEAVASNLARNALLDYGAIGRAEREILARRMMFWAFRRQMAVNTVQMLIRNPSDFRRVAQFSIQQMRSASAWALSPEDYQVRLFARFSEEVWDDYAYTGHYGMGVPFLETFQDLLAAMSWLVYEQNLETAKLGGEGFFFTPEMELYRKIRTWRNREQRVGWVDPRHVAFLMKTRTWPAFYRYFKIEEVPYEQRRPGEPTFHDQQFKFGNSDKYEEYLWWQYVMLKGGLDRTFRDYMTMSWQAGLMIPEGAELKRYSDEQGWDDAITYALSMDTPIKVPTKLQREADALRAIKRDLEGTKR